VNRSRLTLLVTVSFTHAAVLGGLFAFSFGHGRPAPVSESLSPIQAQLIVQAHAKETVPFPEVPLTFLQPTRTALEIVRFDDNSADISGVIGSVSSPELARAQFVDAKSYAQRAGLTPGHSVTVLFVLEVLADGTVGSVTLLRGTGNPEVDNAALAYAQLLRWTPGTVNHHAQGMRIQLPVTLANPI